MARYRAKAWLGTASGFQELEVNANTIQGAREQMERTYGASQIYNLRQVSNSNSSSIGNVGGSLSTVAFLILIFILIEYWKYIMIGAAVAVIIGIIYYFFRK